MDNGDGSVTDTATGLDWTRDATPLDAALLYDETVSRVSGLGLAGGGWRLPTAEEMQSLLQGWQAGPFTDVRTGQVPYFTDSVTPAGVWVLFIGHGAAREADKEHELCYAWPVRRTP